MSVKPLFCVVAPMKNESGNIQLLAQEIAAACTPIGPFEAIFVNDGSTDTTSEEIATARRMFPWLREVRHVNSCGQSAAVRSGVLAAQAAIICTLDGDGQNPPSNIPKLVQPLLTNTLPLPGLVAGQRVGRIDTASKKIASKWANKLRAAMLKDSTRDTGCGLKAFPRTVFLSLPYFDHIHRYLPALVKREGLEVLLVDVTHRGRQYGTSNYTNFGRAMVGVQDLLGVWWLLRRRKIVELEKVTNQT